jgi:hypothetical protein
MGADEYGIVPHGIYDDLEDLPLDLLAVFSMAMGLANDHGLFEGRLSAFARSVARPMDEIGPRLDELERRGLVSFYEVEKATGGVVRVGEIVGFLDYRGQPDTRTAQSHRRRSAYPTRDGTFPAYRGHAAKGNGGDDAPRTERASSAQDARKTRVPSAQDARTERASTAQDARTASEAKRSEAKPLSPPREREREAASPPKEPEPPRPVPGKQPQPSAAAAPLGGAPPGEPARGDGPAAPDGATPAEPEEPPFVPPVPLPGQRTFVPDPAYLPADWPRDSDGAPVPFVEPDNPGPSWLAWKAKFFPPVPETDQQKRKRWAAERDQQRIAAGYR